MKFNKFGWCIFGITTTIHFLHPTIVLGDHLGRAWDPAGRNLQGRLGASGGKAQRLLQRGPGRQVGAQVHPSRPRARNDGLGPFGPLRAAVQAGQLRFRTERGWEQLGQGALHRGCRDRRRRSRGTLFHAQVSCFFPNIPTNGIY